MGSFLYLKKDIESYSCGSAENESGGSMLGWLGTRWMSKILLVLEVLALLGIAVGLLPWPKWVMIVFGLLAFFNLVSLGWLPKLPKRTTQGVSYETIDAAVYAALQSAGDAGMYPFQLIVKVRQDTEMPLSIDALGRSIGRLMAAKPPKVMELPKRSVPELDGAECVFYRAI